MKLIKTDKTQEIKTALKALIEYDIEKPLDPVALDSAVAWINRQFALYCPTDYFTSAQAIWNGYHSSETPITPELESFLETHGVL